MYRTLIKTMMKFLDTYTIAMTFAQANQGKNAVGFIE